MPEKELRNFLSNEYKRMYAGLVTRLADQLLVSTERLDPFIQQRLNELNDIIDSFENSSKQILRNETTNLYTGFESQTAQRLSAAGATPQIRTRTLSRTTLESLLTQKFQIQDRQIRQIHKDARIDLSRTDRMRLSILRAPEGSDLRVIGRQIIDHIRDIGTDAIEDQILSGRSWRGTEKQIFSNLQKLATEEKITYFGKIDDPKQFFFNLRTIKGDFRRMNGADYANLIARTTQRETQWTARVATANELGNFLVKFSFRGSNPKLDPGCARIDGKIFSTKRGYVASNGVKYPYLWDNLPAKFTLPHPRCKHTLTIVIDTPQNLGRFS